MNQTKNAPLLEIPLENGKVWTGTEAQLRRDHPDWLPLVDINKLRAQATSRTKDDSDMILIGQEMDFADDPRPGRLPNSSRTYAPVPGRKRVEYEYQDEIVHTTIPPRRSAQRQPHPNRNRAQPPDVIEGQPARSRYTEEPPAVRTKKRGIFRSHPLLWLGLGMLLALLAWYGLSNLAAWWQVHTDDVTYGRPRTAQYDVVVGHNDDPDHPTHIIAINLHNRVVIVEIPGGDTSKSRMYSGPQLFGPGSDLAPVTLTFPDPDHTGYPQMIVHVQGAEIVYLNQKVNNVWQFVPQQNH